MKDDADTVHIIVGRMEADRLNQPNTEGWIHLHEAAYAGSLECLIVLIKGMSEKQFTTAIIFLFSDLKILTFQVGTDISYLSYLMSFLLP